MSDLLPATDGLFLGSDTRRWDGSKLINLPSGGNHNILSATHLDTLADIVVAGDLLYGNSTPKWARLPKSTDGKYLKLISGLPAWNDLMVKQVESLPTVVIGEILFLITDNHLYLGVT